MKKYRCTICGYIYDDEKEKIKFEDLPDDWTCPLCGAAKNLFEEIKEETQVNITQMKNIENEDKIEDDTMRELSNSEIAYICYNLAKGCEKQYLFKEQKIFNDIADAYIKNEDKIEGSINDIKLLVEKDKILLENSSLVADENNDKGAKRVITWANKTTNIISSILDRYEKDGMDFINNSKIWVCDICGFVYIGDQPPKTCPICKVQNLKILEVK